MNQVSGIEILKKIEIKVVSGFLNLGVKILKRIKVDQLSGS